MEKKLKKNQVLINNKVYTKEVTAVVFNGKYVPKIELETDTYTGTLDLKRNLKPYKDILTGETSYSSNLVVYIHNGIAMMTCASILSKYKNEIIRGPGYNGMNSYASKYDVQSVSKSKYSPEKKIYNLSHYDKDLKPYTDIDTVLNFIRYTFGFEIETSMGIIAEKLANEMGFAMLYDGSITGAEYVSAPMTVNNLQDLKVFLNYAKKVTNIDQYCSLHIHIGNIVKGDRELLAMYQLFQRLTDELNQIIVPYKKDIRFLADKLQKNGRDHCKNLPKLLSKDVESIYRLLRLDKYLCSNEKDTAANLRSYIDGHNKWNMEGRYYSVNFLNYICRQKNNTVEIRSLQSTYNFDYVLTWLLINTAIVDYAINNYDVIMENKVKIEIEDVLKAYIKDKPTLEITLENVIRLKRLFYDSYHLNNNSLNDLRDAEYRIDGVIIPYDHLYKVETSDNRDSLYYKLCNVSRSSSSASGNSGYITLSDAIKEEQASARLRRLYDERRMQELAGIQPVDSSITQATTSDSQQYTFVGTQYGSVGVGSNSSHKLRARPSAVGEDKRTSNSGRYGVKFYVHSSGQAMVAPDGALIDPKNGEVFPIEDMVIPKVTKQEDLPDDM